MSLHLRACPICARRAGRGIHSLTRGATGAPKSPRENRGALSTLHRQQRGLHTSRASPAEGTKPSLGGEGPPHPGSFCWGLSGAQEIARYSQVDRYPTFQATRDGEGPVPVPEGGAAEHTSSPPSPAPGRCCDSNGAPRDGHRRACLCPSDPQGHPHPLPQGREHRGGLPSADTGWAAQPRRCLTDTGPQPPQGSPAPPRGPELAALVRAALLLATA